MRDMLPYMLLCPLTGLKKKNSEFLFLFYFYFYSEFWILFARANYLRKL
jgi:hypothetical protein